MKANQDQFFPRKHPRQERARFTVECILKAAKTIITQKGYEAATTNNIADMAGVSIGSLYQYFPGKEAIVASLVEEAVLESGESIRRCLIDRMNTPLNVAIHEIVRHLVSVRRDFGFVFRRLAREVPKFGKISGQLTTEKYLYQTVYSFYSQHRSEITVKDLEMAMFVVEPLVIGTIDAYLDDNESCFDEDEIVIEISEAVLKYLTK